jgi:hypothetical protein
MELLKGDGMFAVDVVGESHYELNLRHAFGQLSTTGEEVACTATLVLENTNVYDANAVRVEVAGRKVGHLSRQDAVVFRERYAPSGVDGTAFSCNATMIGRLTDDRALIGVVLDIPALSGVRLTPRKTEDDISPRINARRRADRCINEILGLVKGMIADGVVTDSEIRALKAWFSANPDAIAVWPGSVLASRLRIVLEDGTISEEERNALGDLMRATIGEENQPDTNPVTDLPFDVPPPPLLFPERTYLFTGEFVYGTRKECQQAVIARGGMVASRPTRSVNVLVVGCIGNADWIHTSFGRKIEAAVRMRRDGLPIVIVDERHWTRHLI